MKKVLSIGSKPYSKFGISQVTGVMSELQFKKNDIQLEHLSSYNSNRNLLGKILIFSISWLELILIQRKFDIFHLHCSSGGSLIRNYIFIFILELLGRKNKILHIHGDIVNRTKGRSILKKISEKLFKKADYIVLLTDEARNKYIKKYSLDLNKCFVLPNSVPVRRLQKQFLVEDRSVNEEVKKIIFLGTVAKHKGIEDYLEAASQLLSENYTVEFLVAGTGENFKQFKNDYSEYDRIKFLGWLEGKQKWEFLSNGDILVIPSTCSETFGIVAIEGMVFGLSLIVSNRGSLKNLVDHKKNGLLFEAGNIEELKKRMERLISDFHLRRKFSQNNIKKARKFDRKNFQKKLADIYLSI